MRYCRFCGKPIDDDSSFCTHCGQSQDAKKNILGLSLMRVAERAMRQISSIAKKCWMTFSSLSLQFKVTSSRWAKIKIWMKRIAILALILFAISLLILLGFWMFGLYKTSIWEKEDERRESIALKDINRADEIARQFFAEYADDTHRYKFNYSNCGFDHIQKGLEILRYAAEKGSANAQFTLGCIYAGARYDYKNAEWGSTTMLNTDIDNERAAYWYNQAAKQGHNTAMVNLSCAYLNGNGVKKDLVKATELIKVAAEKGNALAQLNFGDMYRDGDVCFKVEGDSADFLIKAKPNVKLAKEWWTKALKNGNEKAKERLERLYE